MQPNMQKSHQVGYNSGRLLPPLFSCSRLAELSREPPPLLILTPWLVCMEGEVVFQVFGFQIMWVFKYHFEHFELGSEINWQPVQLLQNSSNVFCTSPHGLGHGDPCGELNAQKKCVWVIYHIHSWLRICTALNSLVIKLRGCCFFILQNEDGEEERPFCFLQGFFCADYTQSKL